MKQSSNNQPAPTKKATVIRAAAKTRSDKSSDNQLAAGKISNL